jgi:hypothetical protein
MPEPYKQQNYDTAFIEFNLSLLRNEVNRWRIILTGKSIPAILL